MESSPGLERIEVFCKNENCGDPISDGRSGVHYTKRRMNLTGKPNALGVAVFTCPVCGRQRRFQANGWSGKIIEK